jgi:hypothetical protein
MTLALGERLAFFKGNVLHYSLEKRLCGPESLSGSSRASNSAVQPVAVCYDDGIIPDLVKLIYEFRIAFFFYRGNKNNKNICVCYLKTAHLCYEGRSEATELRVGLICVLKPQMRS